MTNTSKQVKQNTFDKAKEFKSFTLVRVLLQRHQTGICVLLAIGGWAAALSGRLAR